MRQRWRNWRRRRTWAAAAGERVSELDFHQSSQRGENVVKILSSKVSKSRQTQAQEAQRRQRERGSSGRGGDGGRGAVAAGSGSEQLDYGDRRRDDGTTWRVTTRQRGE
jgi:hypothetical protein